MKKFLTILLLLSTISYGQTYYHIGAGTALSTSQKEESAMTMSTKLSHEVNRVGLMASFSIVTGIDHTFDSYALEATYKLTERREHHLLLHSGYVLDHNRRRQQTRQGGIVGITNMFLLEDGIYAVLDMNTRIYKDNFIPEISIGLVLRATPSKKKVKRFF